MRGIQRKMMSRNITKEPKKDDEKDLEKDDALEYIET